VNGAGGLQELGAPRAVRWLALRFLHQAQAARARLDDPADARALHDFRVALRRLRSTLRAYADHLDAAADPDDRRRLRGLARASGAARDGEVMIGWMEARRDGLGEDAVPGLDWLQRRLRARQGELDVELRRQVARDFGRTRRRLSARLARYPASVSQDTPRETPRMGGVAAERAAEHAQALRSALDTVRSVDDQDRAHEGRIEAKRLRYLLEPFAGDDDAARALVRRLKQLQDLLGEMHDAHVAGTLLAEERTVAEAEEPDAVPGVVALAAAARGERERRFAEAERDWLGGRADGFFAEVDAFVARLRSGDQADREIERKFLLVGMPRLPKGAARTEIVQGWLPGERLQERLRRVRRRGEPPRYYRTVKLGSGISRIEVEEEADEATFRRLWPLTKGRRVRKLRYRVQDGGLTWEIDRFRGRTLFLAEVELPTEDHDVALPDWLRDRVERDVTDESEYVNINLAR